MFSWLIRLIVLAAVGAGIYHFASGDKTLQVDSFESCVKAGGHILESYPEQCTIPGLSKTFPNPAQTVH